MEIIKFLGESWEKTFWYELKSEVKNCTALKKLSIITKLSVWMRITVLFSAAIFKTGIIAYLEKNPLEDIIQDFKTSIRDSYPASDIYGDVSTWIKALTMLSAYIVPWILLLTVHIDPWHALGLCFLMGLATSGIGMNIMHDAAHGSFSENRWLNMLLKFTICLNGLNPINWWIQHNFFHHKLTNIEGADEDIQASSLLLLSEHAVAKPYHRYQFLYAWFLYALLTIGKFIAEPKLMASYKKMGLEGQLKFKARNEYIKMGLIKTVYIFSAIILPLLITPFSWWQVLIGLVTIHSVASITMTTIFQLAHVVKDAKQFKPDENGVIHTSWPIHEILTTANFKTNWLLSFLIGGLNYQIEHHLFPEINHRHYPAISIIVQRVCEKYNVPYNQKSSFSNALWSHIQRLIELPKIQLGTT